MVAYHSYSKHNKNSWSKWKGIQFLFDNWLLVLVQNIIHEPKDFNPEQDLKEGHVVLFLKPDLMLTKR